MLCTTRYFPSRLSLAPGSIKHLGSIFRRLYRIFAHAWFQHRNVFWDVESEFGLYLVSVYQKKIKFMNVSANLCTL